MTGFAGASTATLQTTRARLLAGLDVVAGHIQAGTFHTRGPKGGAPPSQSGRLTLALLDAVDAELATRSLRTSTGTGPQTHHDRPEASR